MPNSIAYFVLSKIPFVVLLGMMLATAALLHGMVGDRVASGGGVESASRSLYGEVGRLTVVAIWYMMLCVFLAIGAGMEVLKTLRDGQWALAGSYTLPVVALAASVALLSYQMGALIRLASRRAESRRYGRAAG